MLRSAQNCKKMHFLRQFKDRKIVCHKIKRNNKHNTLHCVSIQVFLKNRFSWTIPLSERTLWCLIDAPPTNFFFQHFSSQGIFVLTPLSVKFWEKFHSTCNHEKQVPSGYHHNGFVAIHVFRHILLLWDLSTLCVVDHLWALI